MLILFKKLNIQRDESGRERIHSLFFLYFSLLFFFCCWLGFHWNENELYQIHNAVLSNRIEMLLQQKPLVTKQVFFFSVASPGCFSLWTDILLGSLATNRADKNLFRFNLRCCLLFITKSERYFSMKNAQKMVYRRLFVALLRSRRKYINRLNGKREIEDEFGMPLIWFSSDYANL